MLYGPPSPPGSNSGAFGAEILSHLEELTYKPDAPLPDLLAGLTFQREPSCTAVKNFGLGADARGEGGGRKVDKKWLPFRQSIGSDGKIGMYERPTTLTTLEGADYGTLGLVIPRPHPQQ